MAKRSVIIKKMGNLLIIGDDLYEPVYVTHQRDDELLRFKKISKKRFLSLKRKITERLKGKIKSEDILENALNDMNMKGLERIDKELNKPKPKVRREHGCFDLVVGIGKNATTIPIR
jgi:hypothetical protein